MTLIATIQHRIAIAGSVTDKVSGRPIAAAVVTLSGRSETARTRPDGCFHFVDLPAGTYTLGVAAPHLGTRYGTATVANVAVQNDAQGRPVLDKKANVLLPSTTLRGTVRRAADNQPIPYADVHLRGSDIAVRANAQGVYVVSAVQAGPQTVSASAPGFTRVSAKVTLAAGQDLTRNFSLKV